MVRELQAHHGDIERAVAEASRTLEASRAPRRDRRAVARRCGPSRKRAARSAACSCHRRPLPRRAPLCRLHRRQPPRHPRPPHRRPPHLGAHAPGAPRPRRLPRRRPQRRRPRLPADAQPAPPDPPAPPVPPDKGVTADERGRHHVVHDDEVERRPRSSSIEGPRRAHARRHGRGLARSGRLLRARERRRPRSRDRRVAVRGARENDGTIVRRFVLEGQNVRARRTRLAREGTARSRAGVRDWGRGPREARFSPAAGPTAVLAYIAGTTSDFAKRAYFTELFAQGHLDSTALAVDPSPGRQDDVVGLRAGRSARIGSVRPVPARCASAQAYADAAGSIQSDFELHHALLAALRQTGLGNARRLSSSVPPPGARRTWHRLRFRGGELCSSRRRRPSSTGEWPLLRRVQQRAIRFRTAARADGHRARGRRSRRRCSSPSIDATRRHGERLRAGRGARGPGGYTHLDHEARQSAIGAARAIGSDFERGRALAALVPGAPVASR